MTGSGPANGPGSGPANEPGITVRGGAGGTVALLEDLATAAAALDRVAAGLAEARQSALALGHAIDDGARWSPATARHARYAIGELVAPHAGPAARAAEAAGLAERLRATAALYAGTDLSVTRLLQGGAVLGARTIGEAGPLVWPAAAAVGGLVVLNALSTATVLRWLAWAPSPVGAVLRLAANPAVRNSPQVGSVPGARLALDVTFGGTGPFPHLAPPRSGEVQAVVPVVAAGLAAAAPGRAGPSLGPGGAVPDVARFLALGGLVLNGLTGQARTRLVVTPVVGASGGPGGPGEPAGPVGPAARSPGVASTAEVLDLMDRQYPARGGTPGSIAVQRLDHADGTRSWVVMIPGTQEQGLLPGENPMDMSTNIAIVGGLPDDMSTVVERALATEGVGPGEPVLLAGHSQGGLVAARLAAAPEVGGTYDVVGVVTAGSPVAGQVLPDGLPALHLEHAQDLVPAVEGGANPETPYRTTVVRDLALATSAEDRAAGGAVGTAHALGAYVATARSLEGTADPSVRSFDAAVAGALGGPGTVATTTVYQGVRLPPGDGPGRAVGQPVSPSPSPGGRR